MKYTIKEKTKVKIIFEAINNKEEIENAKKKVYGELIQKVTVPGFRKGKAPYEMGAAFVGEGRILEEAVNTLLESNLTEFLDKEAVNPVVQPDVKVDKIDNNELVCTYTVEFLPDIKIDLSKKIEVTYKKPDTEKGIQAKLKELQDSFTEVMPVERAVKNGDIVSINWLVEGRKEEPRNDAIEVGKDKFVGNFEDNIIGKKKGDKFTIGFKDEKIVINVLGVKEKNVLPIDDNLAKEAGYESLEVLKDKIKKEIEENSRVQAEEDRGRQALNLLAEKLDVELPEKLVKKETEERIKRVKDGYLKRGEKLEDILKKESKTMDAFEEEIKRSVTSDIKKDLVIGSIVKKYGLTVDEEEIKEEFDRFLQSNGLMGKNVKLNNNFRMLLKDDILRKKAISLLKENAIIKNEKGDE